MSLLGGNKHRMSFRNLQGKLVASLTSIQFPKIAVDSLFQLSQIVRLGALASIISIHANARILNCLWEIINVDGRE